MSIDVLFNHKVHFYDVNSVKRLLECTFLKNIKMSSQLKHKIDLHYLIIVCKNNKSYV